MLIRLPNARVTCLALALAFVAGCHSRRPADLKQPLPLSSVGQEVQRRGYHVKESFVVAPTSWDISTFRMRSRRVFSFRANQPEPGTTNYFCRFSLFEETYDSPADAQYRLANVHLPNPNGDEMERDYLSAMRTGFRVGNVTYVLQTDASAFWDEVKQFAKELAGATPGAELTRAIIKPPSNDSLDRERRQREVIARFPIADCRFCSRRPVKSDVRCSPWLKVLCN